jgi:hypothetical protein
MFAAGNSYLQDLSQLIEYPECLLAFTDSSFTDNHTVTTEEQLIEGSDEARQCHLTEPTLAAMEMLNDTSLIAGSSVGPTSPHHHADMDSPLTSSDVVSLSATTASAHSTLTANERSLPEMSYPKPALATPLHENRPSPIALKNINSPPGLSFSIDHGIEPKGLANRDTPPVNGSLDHSMPLTGQEAVSFSSPYIAGLEEMAIAQSPNPRPDPQSALPVTNCPTPDPALPPASGSFASKVAPPSMPASPVSATESLSSLPAPVTGLGLPAATVPIQQEVTTALAARTTEDVIADLKRSFGTSNKSSPSKSSRGPLSPQSDELKPPGSVQVLLTDGHEESDLENGENEEDDDDDDDDEIRTSAKPRKLSERKRRMNAIADNYIQESILRSIKEDNQVKPGDEVNQSARWLVNQSESQEIISTPREYQTELFERAKEKNIIAVLDTGSFHT